VTRRAVIVSPAPGVRGGGVERHCAQVGDMLRSRGWTVEEVGPVTTPVSNWGRRLGLGAIRSSWTAGRAARGRGADLVITNGTLGAGAPADVPHIHVFHGTMAHHVWHGEAPELHRREVVRRIVSYGLAEVLGSRGATMVAVSAQVAREVRAVYRRRVDEVIPLAVDTGRFRPRDRDEGRRRLGLAAGEPVALYVGRVERRKGGDLLMPACQAAGVSLAVAGTGAPAGAHDLGQLDHDDLPWAYAAADVVLFPTRYEGFGYVALEALASERPLVTTPTGWAADLPRLVPGFERFVVAPDPGALAGALRAAVAGGQDHLLPAAAAHVRTEHALERFDERWAALVERVVSAGRSSPLARRP
jgi:glycosyltransferase involved in cell wall biosynthesis